ncbi:MAG: UvrB/UvrC motif-containing protein [Clostridia bacterium]|nr:UvrB/UvrC motif-containing protein [Clostridia bacterium]
MLCQKCGKHEATTHIKQVINGEFEEIYLCSDCARKSGYTDSFSGFGFDLSSFFPSFFSQPKAAIESGSSERCPKCGTSFREIVKSGKIGCAECYEKFYDLLIPSIRRIHGKTRHSGKAISPVAGGSVQTSVEEKISRLKEKLQQSVEKQEFEEAAKLRDEIKSLESEAENQ